MVIASLVGVGTAIAIIAGIVGIAYGALYVIQVINNKLAPKK